MTIASDAVTASSRRIAPFSTVNGTDFPSISTGVYHFPLEQASVIAIRTISDYLKDHPEIEKVRMVCFDEGTKKYYEEARASIER